MGPRSQVPCLHFEELELPKVYKWLNYHLLEPPAFQFCPHRHLLTCCVEFVCDFFRVSTRQCAVISDTVEHVIRNAAKWLRWDGFPVCPDRWLTAHA